MNGNDVIEHLENNRRRLEIEFLSNNTDKILKYLEDIGHINVEDFIEMYYDEFMEFVAQDLAQGDE